MVIRLLEEDIFLFSLFFTGVYLVIIRGYIYEDGWVNELRSSFSLINICVCFPFQPSYSIIHHGIRARLWHRLGKESISGAETHLCIDFL